MNQKQKADALWFLKHSAEHTRTRFLELGKTVFCQKGTCCLRARETNHQIFFLLSGKAAVYNLTSCGNRKILFVLGADSMVNESLTGNISTIFCETLEPCHLYVISRDVLLSLMGQDFGLTRALLSYQEKKIWRLEHQLKNTVGSIYLERKLASKLWKLARDFGIPTEHGVLIDMDLSITFLADLLGAPRETTSRVCKKLSDRGLILMKKKRICIPDPVKISHFYKSIPDRKIP